MAGPVHVVHRLTDKDFQAALKLLHNGIIPGNFSDVVVHINGTVKELMEFTGAMIECALRLNNKNEVLEDILQKADVRYENTPDGPRKIMKNQEEETT